MRRHNVGAHYGAGLASARNEGMFPCFANRIPPNFLKGAADDVGEVSSLQRLLGVPHFHDAFGKVLGLPQRVSSQIFSDIFFLHPCEIVFRM